MAEPVIGANSTGSNRKVWVVNNNRDTYVEDFRGEKMAIPGGAQKKVLMPYLAARRFLGQPKAPATILADGTFLNMPKALETVELTDEERMKYEGKTTEEMAKEFAEENKEASAKHTAEMKKGSSIKKMLLGED
jgi:hypothetical protein